MSLIFISIQCRTAKSSIVTSHKNFDHSNKYRPTFVKSRSLICFYIPSNISIFYLFKFLSLNHSVFSPSSLSITLILFLINFFIIVLFLMHNLNFDGNEIQLLQFFIWLRTYVSNFLIKLIAYASL